MTQKKIAWFKPGERPLVLASAGIGITPVLAILHALAAMRSTREIWWLYGARNGRHHPFARRVARPAAPPAPWPEPNLVQQTDARGSTRHGFRCPWPSGGSALRRIEGSARGRFLPMRSNGIHARREHGSRSLGRSPARIYTEVFGSGESSMPGIVNRHHRLPHSPVGLVGDRAARLVCAQQSLDSLGSEVPKPAGACRSLRCSREMVVPHRGVPPLRERTRGRSGRLPARSARIPCRGQRAHLLLPASGRRRHRPLSYYLHAISVCCRIRARARTAASRELRSRASHRKRTRREKCAASPSTARRMIPS